MLDSNTIYMYHNDNDCYKSYTLEKTLQHIKKGHSQHIERSDDEDDQPCEQVADILTTPARRRSSITPRQSPSCGIDPRQLKCIVCGNVTMTLKQDKVRDKYRLCAIDRAEHFLKATKYFKDDVFQRVPDLNTCDDVFAADIYTHTVCLRNYLYKFDRKQSEVQDTDIGSRSQKHSMFLQALDYIDPLLKDGHGFTMTEIKDFMVSFDEDVNVYNYDVKHFLSDHYGNDVQFCQPHEKNKPEMVFSSHVTSDVLASKLRALDVMKEAGNILSQEMKKVDFGLHDKFCDGHELKKSWENTSMPDSLLTFFSSLFSIKKSRLLKIEMMQMAESDEINGDYDGSSIDDDVDPEIEWAVKHQHSQLQCLFQILYFQLFHGARKTPLHAMLGQSVYGKCRSRELLTSLNRIGVSTGYKEVRGARNLLSAYAIQKSVALGTPIPSHFTREGFTVGALDNADFADNSSLSGTKSSHDTVMVLFQDASSRPQSKPHVSSTGVSKSTRTLNQMLPCQTVPVHHKPVVRPSLPQNFTLAEDTNLVASDTAIQKAMETEFLISFVRCGLANSSPGELPPWGGIHALISSAEVPLMRVGFLPVIPSPVTDYATVRKALTNFQSVRAQLDQATLPVFCDEGVFHTVADIVMSEPTTFQDVYPMMGMFHMSKVLLRCAGRYISGSGMEDALIESEVFGKRTLQSVLSGSHYVRALRGMLIVSEVLDTLAWTAFWQNNDPTIPFVASVEDLKIVLGKKQHCESRTKFDEVLSASDDTRQTFQRFLRDCEAKSEVCSFWGVFQAIVGHIKHLIAADRDGNWEMHVSTVQSVMCIFREFDAINYLRYGSWYLERIKVLEVEYPALHKCFMNGQFVVKDRSGSFNAVAPDMKLEQSIQRASKGQGGIVGQTRNSGIVVEWQLLFHEVLCISNIFRGLTNERLMDHMETAIHHELSGRKGELFDNNVAKLLEFVQSHTNPFVIHVPGIQLHNFITKRVINDEIQHRLTRAMENGEKAYRQFRHERFVAKTKKLSDTITKQKLRRFDTTAILDKTSSASSQDTTTKDVASAQRDTEIAKERGMSLSDIFTHDLLTNSPLFDGDLPTKPTKSILITELETYLNEGYYEYQRQSLLKTTIIVDFMSKVRQIPNLSSFRNFGDAVSHVFKSARSVCLADEIHVVFDSYTELSIKDCERIRRAGTSGSVDLAAMDESVPIPQQIDKFWTSSKNKSNLQQLARDIAIREVHGTSLVLSGLVANHEALPASLYEQPGSNKTDLPELSNWLEEADSRIIPHTNWAIEHGSERIVVTSNDTDSIILLLRYLHYFINNNLKELWVQFGVGVKRRLIPLHILCKKLGASLCQVLVKAHVTTGDDTLSKVGTTHSAIACNPVAYLANFGECSVLSETEIRMAELFLVRVWSGARAKPTASTFDELRLEVHTRSSVVKSLEALPPTSSAMHGHITRSFFVIRGAVTLLDNSVQLDPTDYGWDNVDGSLKPSKCLKPIPVHLLMTCKCGGKCDTKRCGCRSGGVMCVFFCHKKANNCENK